MKAKNFQTVALIVVAITAYIFIVLTSYLKWDNDQINKKLDSVKNDYNSAIEELSATNNELKTVKEALDHETVKSSELNKSLEDIRKELEIANTTIGDLKSEEYKFVYIGNYTITHYCTEMYEHICGTGNGLTATGTHVTAGRTVAVDPSVIPYGTKMYIEGYGFRVAEDCGGAVNGYHIDVAVGTHSQAMAMGTNTSGVWILVKNNS